MKNVFRGISKKLLVVMVLCGIIACSSVALAAYMIYSNVVTENVSAYTLVLTSSNPNPVQYNNVTFSATLDLNGSPTGSGKTVGFYQGSTLLGSNVTDVNGVASFEWNMTNVGAIDFKAGYQVP